MASWNADNPNFTKEEESLGRLTDYLLGKNFPGINHDIKRGFSLYRFILVNKNASPELLHSSILEHGKPMFSLDDIKSMLKTIHRNQGLDFKRKMVGGVISINGFNMPGLKIHGLPLSGIEMPMSGVQIAGAPKPMLKMPSVKMPSGPMPGLQMPAGPMPGLQMPAVPMPGLQMPGLQMPGVQMPGLQMPGLQMPGLQMPGLQMPGLQMPGATMPAGPIIAGPMPGAPMPNAPMPNAPMPAGPMPNVPTPGAPMPAGPIMAGPMPGAPMPNAPTPGAPMPAGPIMAGPMPGTPMPNAPTPGAPMPAGPIIAGPMPGAPTPGAPMPAGPMPNSNLTKKNSKLGKDGKPEIDETRNEFFDKLIRKITYNLPSLPKCFDGILWYYFILYNLEQTEFFGPMLATTLDAITLSLPVLADLSIDVVSKLMGLIPIPYVNNYGGELVGYLISLIFVFLGITLNISRKHFGTAFKSSLMAFPLVGNAMFDAARSFEQGMSRYEISKKKLLKSVDKISPSTEDFIDYYTPDSAIHPGPAPTLSYEMVKGDVVEYVKEATGLNKALNAIPDPSKLTAGLPAYPSMNGLTTAVSAAVAPAVSSMPSAAAEVPAVPSEPAAPATAPAVEAVPAVAAVPSAPTALPPALPPAKGGRQTISKKLKRKNKRTLKANRRTNKSSVKGKN